MSIRSALGSLSARRRSRQLPASPDASSWLRGKAVPYGGGRQADELCYKCSKSRAVAAGCNADPGVVIPGVS
jgi:hypothetical protein